MQCPHCQHHFTPTNLDEDRQKIFFTTKDYTGKNKCGELIHIVCPNEECKKTIIVLDLEYSYGGCIYDKFYSNMIYPEQIIKEYPEYIPYQIREDYEEACKIANLSPKAAATLARRCLQGIIRDFYKAHHGLLCNEIDSVKEKMDTDLYDAITAVRQIGNIGAHMEKDVNIIVEIEPQEAWQLIRLIELLFDETYIRSHKRQQRLQAIKQINEDKQAQRQGTADGTAS